MVSASWRGSFFRYSNGSRLRRERARLRAARERMLETDRDGDAMMREIDRGADPVEALDRFLERHGDAADRERLEEHRARLQAIQDEGEALRQIRQAAGDESPQAVEGYRAYLRDHPESHMAWDFLGSALKQVGDLDGGLEAYRHALRLAEESSPLGTWDRLWIAQTLQERGDLEAAEGEYRRLLADPSAAARFVVPAVHLYLGDTLRERGDAAGARDAWKKALKTGRHGPVAGEARSRLEASGQKAAS